MPAHNFDQLQMQAVKNNTQYKKALFIWGKLNLLMYLLKSYEYAWLKKKNFQQFHVTLLKIII